MISKIIHKNNRKLLVIDITDDDVRNECWHRFNLANTTVRERTTRGVYPTLFESDTDIWYTINEDCKRDK